MPRFCEQSGLFSVVPTPRDAGGTVSVCVAARARTALAVSRALLAEFGWFGTTVCCGIELEDGVGMDGGGDVFGWRTGVCTPGIVAVPALFAGDAA